MLISSKGDESNAERNHLLHRAEIVCVVGLYTFCTFFEFSSWVVMLHTDVQVRD